MVKPVINHLVDSIIVPIICLRISDPKIIEENPEDLRKEIENLINSGNDQTISDQCVKILNSIVNGFGGILGHLVETLLG